MSRAVVIGGQTFYIPDIGENNWGQNVSDALVAIAANISPASFFTIVSVSSSPISTVSGRTYLVNTSAARTLNLPTPALGAFILVRDITGTSFTYNITLHRSSGEKIDGTASDKTLNSNYGQWWLVSDGTDWYTVLDAPVNNRMIVYKDTYPNLKALPVLVKGQIFYATDLDQFVGYTGVTSINPDGFTILG